MSKTITLKDIPDDLYNSLRNAAKVHRRSINNEAIFCLERALLPVCVVRDERLVRARKIRNSLNPKHFNASDIAKAIGRDRQ